MPALAGPAFAPCLIHRCNPPGLLDPQACQVHKLVRYKQAHLLRAPALSAHFLRKPAFTATSSPFTTYCATPPLRLAMSA